MIDWPEIIQQTNKGHQRHASQKVPVIGKLVWCNNPPAEPGAFIREPLEAATGSLTRPRGSLAT